MTNTATSNVSRSSWVVDTICAAYILLFTYAAVSKLVDVENFQTQISKSPLLTNFTTIVLICIPTIEIILSLMLSFKKTRLIALYGSYGLMVLFSTYIIGITRFNENTPCSCGGIIQALSWNQHLIFNLIFVFIGFLAVLLHKV